MLMNMRELIGQRLVFGFKGTRLPEDFRKMICEYKIGNVILFRYNVESTAQLRALCAEIQDVVRRETGHPAFITIDQEGGMVTRLPADAVNVPGSMAIAATGRIRDAYDCAGITARQLRGIGVNFNLAPDLDVNSNSMNPVIGVRSFGDDAARAAELGVQAVRGYGESGLLCCGKHFPGHGDTAVDSHIGLPCIVKSLAELERTELVPFRAAIEAGIPAIMSSHILFPQIEPSGVPATMSRRIMHDILRGGLGFDGLVLSDCMVMDAIRLHYGTANGVVAAMKAGVDMVFVCSNPALQRESADAAAAAAERGAIDLAETEESVRRILAAKERYAGGGAEPNLCSRTEDFAAARDVARRAIVHAGGKICAAGERSFFVGCADYRMTQASNADPEALPFPEYMQRRFGGRAAVCQTDPDDAEIARILEAAEGCGNIIMSTCNAHIYRGQLKLAQALAGIGADMTAVALRNPYDLPLLPQNIGLLAAWDYSADSLAALCEVLRGGECTGRMAVKI